MTEVFDEIVVAPDETAEAFNGGPTELNGAALALDIADEKLDGNGVTTYKVGFNDVKTVIDGNQGLAAQLGSRAEMSSTLTARLRLYPPAGSYVSAARPASVDQITAYTASIVIIGASIVYLRLGY